MEGMMLTLAAAIASLCSLVISLGYHILIYLRALRYKGVSWVINPGSGEGLGSGGEGRVRLTIIVPTKNEPLDLLVEATKARADAISRSKYCVGDVLIVTDDSEDYVRRLREALKDEIGRGVVKIYWRRNPRGGRSGALDDGARAADGDYVMVLDSDSKVTPETLDNICLAALEHGYPVIIAPWRGYAKEDGRIPEAMTYSTNTVSHLLYRMRGKAGLFVFPLGSGTAFKKSVLEEVGYWGPNIIQDDIWIGTKLALKGYFPVVLEKGETEVLVPTRLKALRVQQSRWAYGASEVFSRTFLKILRHAKMGAFEKFEMFLYMLQPALTLLILIAAILAFAAAILEPGWTLWKALHTPSLLAIGLLAEAVIIAYIAVQLKLSKHLGLCNNKEEAWNALVQLGRATAMLGVLMPVMGLYALRGLLRFKYRYKITPKKTSGIGRDWIPYAVLAFSAVGTAISIIHRNIVSLTILMPFLIVSVYSLFRLK